MIDNVPDYEQWKAERDEIRFFTEHRADFKAHGARSESSFKDSSNDTVQVVVIIDLTGLGISEEVDADYEAHDFTFPRHFYQMHHGEIMPVIQAWAESIRRGEA